MTGISNKTLAALVMFAIVISAINTMISMTVLATKYTEIPKNHVLDEKSPEFNEGSERSFNFNTVNSLEKLCLSANLKIIKKFGVGDVRVNEFAPPIVNSILKNKLSIARSVGCTCKK